jgi:hypothetical protein
MWVLIWPSPASSHAGSACFTEWPRMHSPLDSQILDAQGQGFKG